MAERSVEVDGATGRTARDGEEFHYESDGQQWLVSWHPPVLPLPDGQKHGSEALCFSSEGQVVLVSQDGESWSMPGGRPEADEEWRATLDREVLEEACASVDAATLLGFTRSVCTSGAEQGLILVRSHWRATVSLLEWDPQHETTHRTLVAPDEALERVLLYGPRPIYQRLFHEASAI